MTVNKRPDILNYHVKAVTIEILYNSIIRHNILNYDFMRAY